MHVTVLPPRLLSPQDKQHALGSRWLSTIGLPDCKSMYGVPVCTSDDVFYSCTQLHEVLAQCKAHPLLRYHPFPLIYRGYVCAIARDVTRVITVNICKRLSMDSASKKRDLFSGRLDGVVMLSKLFPSVAGFTSLHFFRAWAKRGNPSLASFLVP